jgi:hypothetical protein
MAVRSEGAENARSKDVRGRSTRLATETKHALKTTEFWAFTATVVGILAAAQIVSSGNGDQTGDAFKASQAWLYVAIVSVGYMVSRGLAKAGSREPYWSDGEHGGRG